METHGILNDYCYIFQCPLQWHSVTFPLNLLSQLIIMSMTNVLQFCGLSTQYHEQCDSITLAQAKFQVQGSLLRSLFYCAHVDIQFKYFRKAHNLYFFLLLANLFDSMLWFIVDAFGHVTDFARFLSLQSTKVCDTPCTPRIFNHVLAVSYFMSVATPFRPFGRKKPPIPFPNSKSPYEPLLKRELAHRLFLICSVFFGFTWLFSFTSTLDIAKGPPLGVLGHLVATSLTAFLALLIGGVPSLLIRGHAVSGQYPSQYLLWWQGSGASQQMS